MLIRSATFIGLVLLFCQIATAVPAGLAGPLTWSDEFNGNSLDLTKWFYRASGPRHDGVLTPDAVSVGNGLLTIKTYTEAGINYSGMIANYPLIQDPQVNNYNGHQQTYGFFEVRAKFQTTSGVASAFWLQSATVGNPIGNPQAAGVEMDVFEHRVYDPFDYSAYGLTPTTIISNRINEALIWDGYGPEQHLTKQLSNPLTGLANGAWHTYGLSWRPNGYTFYYDDTPLWTGSGGAISGANEYVILSSEVFASFAGAIPQGGYGSKDFTSTNMQIDYIREYAFDEGDYNRDGAVDAADYVLWRKSQGSSVAQNAYADGDGNGQVNSADYTVWRRNFGASSLAAGTGLSDLVPEPRAVALLAIAMLQFVAVRRNDAR